METDPSKMTPAELEELQKRNCVFCHIASGKVPAKKVYEDSECVAVLDINPATPGHVLLMPKEHHTVMFQMPEHLVGHLFVIAKGLSQAGLKAFQSKGTTIFAANGVAAGQRAPHFMLHVIPRMQGDNLALYIPSRALTEKEAGQIAMALTAALGGKPPENPNRANSTIGPSHQKGDLGKEGVKEEAAAEKKSKQPEKSDLDKITDLLAGKGDMP